MTKLTGLVPGLALALAACAADAPSSVEQRAFAGPGIASGAWRVTHVDGARITRDDVFVAIVDDAVVGGFDGCNAWGADEIDGKRVIVSDAMACPGDPLVAAMADIQVTDPAAVTLELRDATSPAPMLVITGAQHSFLATYAPELMSQPD